MSNYKYAGEGEEAVYGNPGPSAYLRGARDPAYIAANDNVPRAHRYSWLKGLDGYAYLATVYSKYQKGRARATEIACLAAAQLMRDGVVVYSPIAHSHYVAEIGGIDPLDWSIWQFQNQPLMDHAAALVVLTMEGWQESVGVTHEIASFVASGRPVLYLAPGELGVVE